MTGPYLIVPVENMVIDFFHLVDAAQVQAQQTQGSFTTGVKGKVLHFKILFFVFILRFLFKERLEMCL